MQKDGSAGRLTSWDLRPSGAKGPASIWGLCTTGPMGGNHLLVFTVILQK